MFLSNWIRANRKTLKVILATSLAWTSFVHLVLFFLLQSELLPLCIFYGSDVHCEGLKLFGGKSYQDDIDLLSISVVVNGSHGSIVGPSKYADFFRILHSQEAKEALSAFQDQLPDYSLGKLAYWYWSKYPGGAPPLHRDPSHKKIPLGLGDRGERIYLQGYAKNESERRFSEHEFDVVISDMISVNRSVPDVRSLACKARKYTAILPTVSIIICFHNEAWSALMRTIWSAINRSPAELLQEIILVDDASDFKYLYNPKNGHTLKMFVNESTRAAEEFAKHADNNTRSTMPVKIKLLTSKERLGLVKARLLGASKANGQVLVFLDSHCECNKGWLPPLLERIVGNRRTIACPVIDVISHVDFSYVATQASNRGGFDWILNFAWFEPSQSNKRPWSWTPAMAGGIFAVDKNYFYEVGAYDKHLSIWGMENIEMSLRVWMCGGRVEIITCSRVGHIFRAKNPANFPEGTRKTILRNRARVAEVWLDEYKNFYFGSRLMEEVDVQDDEEEQKIFLGGLEERKELRERMNCRSFRWFLENLFPESNFPLDYHFLGQIELISSGKCLHVSNDNKTKAVILSNCLQQPGRYQLFAITTQGQIFQNGYHLLASGDSAWIAETDQHKIPTIRWEVEAKERQDGGIKLRLSGTPFCLTWNIKLHKLALNGCEVKMGSVWLMHPYSTNFFSVSQHRDDLTFVETQVEKPSLE